jgi:hypothetical protein
MFNRNQKRFTESSGRRVSPNDRRDDLSRFGNDEYAAKYLSGVYNPEYRVHITRMKDVPEYGGEGSVSWSARTFGDASEVF